MLVSILFKKWNIFYKLKNPDVFWNNYSHVISVFLFGVSFIINITISFSVVTIFIARFLIPARARDIPASGNKPQLCRMPWLRWRTLAASPTHCPTTRVCLVWFFGSHVLQLLCYVAMPGLGIAQCTHAPNAPRASFGDCARKKQVLDPNYLTDLCISDAVQLPLTNGKRTLPTRRYILFRY